MAFNNYLEDENDKPYFTTNSLAYYYDKMEGFAKAVEGSAKELNLTKEEIEQRIALRLAEWDGKLEGFDDDVVSLLAEWVEDGTIHHVIDDTLLKEKPNFSQVRQSTVTKPINVKEMDTETKLLFTGGAVPVVGVNGVGSENLKSKSVTAEKTTFIEGTRNRFFTNEVVFNKTIDASGNVIDSATNWVLSGKVYPEINSTDLIFGYVDSSQVYTPYAVNLVAFYRADHTFISRISTVSTTTIPDGTEYFRFVLPASFSVDGAYKRVSVEKGTTLSTFQEAGRMLNSSIQTKDSSEITVLKTGSKAFNENVGKLTHAVVKNPIDIKFIGTSISHGVGGTGFTNDSANGKLILTVPSLDTATGGRSWYENTNGHCFVNSIRDYMLQKFNVKVKNWGTRGVSATWYMNHNMLPKLIEESDSLVVMEIGTNDRIHATSYSTFLYSLQQVIDYITVTRGKKLILVSSIPSSVSDETASDKKFHMEDVDNAIFHLSKVNNLPYISLYKQFINYCDVKNISIDSLLADGLHPNDAGQDVIYQLLLPALGYGLKRPGATW